MKRPVLACFAFLAIPLLGTCALAEESLESQQSQTRVLVTNVTYDDGGGNALQGPTGITFDSRSNEVILAATGNSRISIYDQNLIPKYSFVHFIPDTTRGGFSISGEPRSVAVMSTGNLLVVDNLAFFVDLLDYRGTRVDKLYPAVLAGDKSLKLRATSVSVDQNDNVYLAVTGDKEEVLVLDNNFNLKRTIGEKGSSAKQFNTIFTINATDSLLYVTDLYGYPAVKVFDTLGTFLFGFGGHTQNAGDVSMPAGIAIMPDTLTRTNLIIMVDALRHSVNVYHENGELLSIIGGIGIQVGEWRYPSGVAIGTKNVFYVAERGNGRVQKVEIRPPR